MYHVIGHPVILSWLITAICNDKTTKMYDEKLEAIFHAKIFHSDREKGYLMKLYRKYKSKLKGVSRTRVRVPRPRSKVNLCLKSCFSQNLEKLLKQI